MNKVLVVIFLLFSKGLVFAQNTPTTLDRAIGDFATYMAGRLPAGSTTAILTVETPVRGLSDYVIEELLNQLYNNARVKVMSRQDFDRVKEEQQLQLNGDVSDETAVRIGHLVGWQTVILGSVMALDTSYRLVLRGVDVESGELRGTRTYSLKEDTVLASILNPRIKPPNITLKELTERQEILRPFEGEHNAFGLEVWPEAGKNVFYEGDRLIIKLRAGTDCYFVVYHVDVDSKIQVIYPNPTDAGTNVLRAGVIRTIPERSSFRLQAPYGEERILIYASDRPFNIPYEQYTPQTISRSLVQAQVRGVDNTPASPPSGGATNQFSYTILPRTK